MQLKQHIPGPKTSASSPALPEMPAYFVAGSSSPNSAATASLITATCLLGGIGSWMALKNNTKEQPEPPLVVPIEPVAGDQTATRPIDVTFTQEPTALLKELIRGLLSRDVNQIVAMGVNLDAHTASTLSQALDSRQITIDPQKPVNNIGFIEGGLHRWAINVQRLADKTKGQLLVDLALDSQGSWAPKQLTLPDHLTSTPSNREVIELSAVLVDSLIKQDFESLAKIATEDALPNEKLAALGLIFQEGEFQPIEDRAFRVTNTTDVSAWVIANVESDLYQLKSEIGLELKKDNAYQWIIERINVSTLMRQFLDIAKESDALKAPLVEDPRGGESVVLYFGYDSDQLTPQSLKQLSVIASILKKTGNNEILIEAHTDSLGEVPYNDALSQRRARRVATTLHSLGVRQSQIKLQSFGERVPLSPNLRPDGKDNPQGRERNRRAEIYLDFLTQKES